MRGWNLHRVPAEGARNLMRAGSGAGVRAAVLGLAGLAAAGFLLSCATVPPRARDTGWLDVLPSDATMYLAADVAANRALLKKALEGAGPDMADVAAMADMSRRALVAVYLQPPEPLRYQAVVLGGYPSFLIGLRLGISADWKRVETPRGAFYLNSKGLQVSAPSDAVLLAASGGMGALLERLYQPSGFPLPPEVDADMGSSDAVLFLPRLPAGLGAMAGGSDGALPIREVWLKARVDGEAYEISGTAAVTGEKSARSVALILRLVLVSWLNTEKVENVAGKLKTVSIVADGPSVRITGLVFSREEILSLLTSLLAPRAPAENG